MRRRQFITILGGAAYLSFRCRCMRSGPRSCLGLGVLLFSTPRGDPNNEAFHRGMSDLGYVDGQNIVFEYRFAEGKPERLPELAADLVRLNPDLIFALGGDVAPASARRHSQFLSLLRLAPILYGVDWWLAWRGRRQRHRGHFPARTTCREAPGAAQGGRAATI